MSTKQSTKMTNQQQFQFGVEVEKILNLMINSLYSNQEVAVRELISNAADACDKLRFLATQKPDLLTADEKLKITVSINKTNKTLTIEDNGIGMNKDDLVQHLGTIAASGTENFVKSLTGDKKKDVELIGQFGVGFYSSFMIASKVEVISRKFDATETYAWESEGAGKYSISETKDELKRGTRVVLHLKENASEFLDRFHLKHVIQTYSNHINFEIELIPDSGKAEVLNSASALWLQPRDKITKEQYQAFFKHISHLPGEPYLTIHHKAEGIINYVSLLFVPESKPFDLYHPDRRTALKLYVKKVFISEDIELVPSNLRFLRGIVESDDLPLNISRETLQHNIVLDKIRKSLVKKVLSELAKKAKDNEEDYLKFWNNFGPVLKEGLCEGQSESREKILELSRFYSSKSADKFTTIEDYLTRMKPGQDKIYFLTSESPSKALSSPQIEAFIAKDVEVLFLTDPVDEFWVTVALPYKEKEFQSITRNEIDLSKIDRPAKTEEEEEKSAANDNAADDEVSAKYQPLLNLMKETLGDKVKDVRISKKLATSPVCLAVDSAAMDIRMERFLHEQKQIPTVSAKIFEINPNNPIIRKLNSELSLGSEKSDLAEQILTLFDLACIIEDEPVANPKDFSNRIEKLMTR